MRKWVWLFLEAKGDMQDLLGGKGAALAEMSQLGLPVPPGFTISTEACNEYHASGRQMPPFLLEQVKSALTELERETGRRLGDSQKPLLLAVRSGAKVSMPGMLDTVLDLGLNEEIAQGLAARTGSECFAYDTYCRFLQSFAETVLAVPHPEFEKVKQSYWEEAGLEPQADWSADQLKTLASYYLRLVKERTGADFPRDPCYQLELAIKAVFDSWTGERAAVYRNFHRIPHDLGTAVNIQAMVFGNLSEDSGSGVVFTRDPGTGAKVLYGEYLPRAQGEDIVAGMHTPKSISLLEREAPQVYQWLEKVAHELEVHYRDVQDIEFVVEQGSLYMLQTRRAQRSAQAAVKVAVDMVMEGLISKEEAILRVQPEQIYQLLLPYFDEQAKKEAQGSLLCRGLAASPGAASGKVCLDMSSITEEEARREAIILVRRDTTPDDVPAMLRSKGVVTARGGVTSHAAVVARGLGKPCVVGCKDLGIDLEKRFLKVNGKIINEFDEISIDGTSGDVFLGHIPTKTRKLSELDELRTLLHWADAIKRLGVWANADNPQDAAQAIEFAAEGIGLARTEHMFLGGEGLTAVQKLILSAGEVTALESQIARVREDMEKALPSKERELAEVEEKYRTSPVVKDYTGSLSKLLNLQVESFGAMFKIMAGRPIVIRLLDPPLHEFLPDHEELLVELMGLYIRGSDPATVAEKQRMLQAVDRMREKNPMLGLRGCRLGLIYEDIYEMQVKAIVGAACDAVKQGVAVNLGIMIPLISHAEEMRVLRQRLEKVAKEVQEEKGIEVPCEWGAMVETPRAALTSDEIAPLVDFFSFGTNDLTQATYCFSRDDAEAKFLLQYIEGKILPENPFQVLDRTGVGKLIQMAVELGRKARPNLKLGICGEHGGDPQSIAFFHQVGLDYISCSPFRVPIARLAAAQAALTSGAPSTVA